MLLIYAFNVIAFAIIVGEEGSFATLRLGRFDPVATKNDTV